MPIEEGGRWILDPSTGERRLVERTREAAAPWERAEDQRTRDQTPDEPPRPTAHEQES